MTTTANSIEDEIRFYYANKPGLLATYRGRYVLIKGARILGVFDSHDAAVVEGLRIVGPMSFLVKHVMEAAPVRFSTLDLGPGLDVDVQP
jgi:hypothetical protein